MSLLGGLKQQVYLPTGLGPQIPNQGVPGLCSLWRPQRSVLPISSSSRGAPVSLGLWLPSPPCLLLLSCGLSGVCVQIPFFL